MIGKNYIEREKLTHICQKGDSGKILYRLKSTESRIQYSCIL